MLRRYTITWLQRYYYSYFLGWIFCYIQHRTIKVSMYCTTWFMRFTWHLLDYPSNLWMTKIYLYCFFNIKNKKVIVAIEFAACPEKKLKVLDWWTIRIISLISGLLHGRNRLKVILNNSTDSLQKNNIRATKTTTIPRFFKPIFL